jgi:hypothetical protein
MQYQKKVKDPSAVQARRRIKSIQNLNLRIPQAFEKVERFTSNNK